MEKATYKGSGVDLDLYRQSMERLPTLMGRTFSPRVCKLDGGFAGLFQLDFANPLFRRDYVDPVLVACTDGVGTKLKVAVQAGQHKTVGIDLVAMCVNDAVCCGAEPLFFLDYVAMSRDNPPLLEQIVDGISRGCVESDCALLGGETAILPDMYQPGDYDLAGFCVGVAERKGIIDGKAIVTGDVVLGVASSGLHSNGFSLVRKAVFEMAKLGVHDHVDVLGETVGNVLLQPTRIYVRAVRNVLSHYRVKNVVHGIAHITGGGLHENIERVLPGDACVVIQPRSWPVSEMFSWIQNLGNVDDDEMYRVFNMGIGLVLVVSAYYANHVQQMIESSGFSCWKIGHVESGQRGVRWSS